MGVVLLDVDIGLLIGLAISIFTVIVRDQLARARKLVKASDPSLGYIDEDLVRQDRPLNVRRPCVTVSEKSLIFARN